MKLPSFSDAQKPLSPGPGRTRRPLRRARGHRGATFGCSLGLFLQGDGGSYLCAKRRRIFKTWNCREAQPGPHKALGKVTPPHPESHGDAPPAPRSFNSWVFSAPSRAEFRAPAGGQRASRRFWARGERGRFGARAGPLLSRPETGREGTRVPGGACALRALPAQLPGPASRSAPRPPGGRVPGRLRTGAGVGGHLPSDKEGLRRRRGQAGRRLQCPFGCRQQKAGLGA